MSVTINTLGTNSRQIVIDGETSAANIISAVNTSLVALGWTLYDTVTSGARNCLVTKVYSAPNDDGFTTKYMIIRYDAPRQQWYVSCCESWNTTTNVATNESWYGNRQILLPLQYSNTILYVFASVNYACFMGTVRGEPSAWQGVFEFQREAAEDVSEHTVPCFGWTSSLTIGEPYGNIGLIGTTSITPNSTSVSNGYVACGFAPPRTKNSLTGAAAAGAFTVLTGIGSYPPAKSVAGIDFANGGILQANNSHVGMLGSFGDGQAYVWDNNKSLISNLKLGGYTTAYVAGKIFGLKTTIKLGAPLDTTVVPVDSDLFYSPAGVNTNHYLLGIHGGYDDKLIAGTNRMTANPSTSGTALGTLNYSVVISGRFLYMATSNGFHKFDMTTLTYTYNILPAAAYLAVKFDGENSLYVTNQTSNIWKINLTDDTFTTITGLSTTVSGISLDDTYLYAASSVTGGTVALKRITLSSFTETASYNLAIGTSNFVTHVTTADYAGYVYVAALQIFATPASCRILRVAGADGNTLSITPVTGLTSSSGTSQTQPMFFDGVSIFFISVSNNSGSGASATTIAVRKISIADFTLSSEFGVTNAVGAQVAIAGGSLTQGCFESPAYAGVQIYLSSNNNSTGLNNNNNTYRIPFSDPRNAPLTSFPANASALDGTYIFAGPVATDNCRLINVTFTTNTVVQYTGTFRNFNFNGVQSSNLLIAQ